MKSYYELKAKMEAVQRQLLEANKNEDANAFVEAPHLGKEFGFAAGMLNSSLAEG